MDIFSHLARKSSLSTLSEASSAIGTESYFLIWVTLSGPKIEIGGLISFFFIKTIPGNWAIEQKIRSDYCFLRSYPWMKALSLHYTTPLAWLNKTKPPGYHVSVLVPVPLLRSWGISAGPSRLNDHEFLIVDCLFDFYFKKFTTNTLLYTTTTHYYKNM